MGPGDVVGDRWVIERVGGTGAMGTVYRARDRENGAAMAVKVMRSSVHAPRFAREVQVMRGLRHPSIVDYVAHGVTDEGVPYLVMEWLEGETLAERLARQPVTIAEAVTLVLRTAEALSVAHAAGVIHRDLKPSNLLLHGGDIASVKLLDFGVARLQEGSKRLTQTGSMIGTPGYMAPEQARGQPNIDARADVFSLGCVLFRCLTGRPAFEGADLVAVLMKTVLEDAPRPRDHRPDIPEALDALVWRMLARSPDDRPPDAGAIVREIRALEIGPPTDREACADLPMPPAPALTSSERRLLCVVLAHGARETAVPEEELERRTLAIVAAVEPLGGRVQFLADGSTLVTLAVAGAATDQAARAARCALAMRDVIPDWPIAVATGRAQVAERGLVGEVVERAAALARLAGARVRLDEVTAGLLEAQFEVGGDESGLVLRGERDSTEATRTLLGKPTRCVGRDRELMMLEASLAHCIEESMSAALLVTADVGIGKSRLRYEFLRQVKQRGTRAAVWMGRAHPMAAGAPFGVLAPLLRRAATIMDGEPIGVRRQKLRARVGRHLDREAAWETPKAADLGRISEFLGELVGVPFPDEESVQLRTARRDPVLMGDQMQRAWVDFLAAECAAQPVLIVLEDLHWGDVPSVRLIASALRTLSDAPLMVLGLGRPEIHHRLSSLWTSTAGSQELRLAPLGARASEALVRETLPADVPAEAVTRIVTQAAGNAFYLEELIRALADGKGDALPETVLAMVQDRLDRLDHDTRRVLRAAAVFGHVFWRGGLSALLGDDATPLSASLVDLVGREIVARRAEQRFPDEEEYIFRHGLVREAAYAGLTEDDRALGHRLACAWLEAAGETDAVVLAEHAERSGDSARAIQWHHRAAEMALDGNDVDAAVTWAARAIEAGAEGEALGALYVLQAEAHRWAFRFAEALACGERAMSLLPRGTAGWFLAAADVANVRANRGELDRVASMLEDLRDAVSAGSMDRTAAICMLRVAGHLVLTSHYALADVLEPMMSRLAAEPVAREPAVHARIVQLRANRALIAGDAGAHLAFRLAAMAAFEEAGDLRNASLQCVNVGSCQLDLGAWMDAERYLRQGLAAADRMGLPGVSLAAKTNLGIALARRGELDEGRRVEEEAAAAGRERGDPRLEGASRTYLAGMLVQAGDLDAAEREAESAVALLSVSRALQTHARAMLAHVLVARGCVEQACGESQEAMRTLESLGGLEEGESFLRLVRAEALRARGDADAAREAIAAARARLLERAATIEDPFWRTSFLERVPENARTLELARAWVDEPRAE